MCKIYNANFNIKQTAEAGFVILTIPVILILFSFFVTSLIKETKPNKFYFETGTQEKLDVVKRALATYAHRNYRVPCPADPAAAPAMLGAEVKPSIGDKCAATKGIIPFKELGLAEVDVKDEWGNYLTYKVSPDFTLNFDNSSLVGIGDGAEKLLTADNSDAQFYVHQLCRTPNWINTAQDNYIMSDGGVATMAIQNINENIYKARFCCPSNVNGLGKKTFSAFDQKSQVGQKIADLDSDGDGTGDGEVTMSIEGLDYPVLWKNPTELTPWTWDNSSYTYADYVDNSQARAANIELHYNEGFIHDGHEVGDGFGPVRWSDGGRSPENSGKYYHEAAGFTINTDKVKTKDMQMVMSDLGSNNWYDPVQIAIDVVGSIDHDNNPSTPKEDGVVDTIQFILQLPEAPTGLGDLSISLDMILGDANQEGLYHPGAPTTTGIVGGSNGDIAVNLFNESKARLQNKLNTAGLSMDDVFIGKLKMNASHASMAFSSVSYGSPGATNNTDLIIRDEKGNARLMPRNNQASYESSDSVHFAVMPVEQDFEAPAYAIISHGGNGEGAYLVNGTQDVRNHIADGDENQQEVDNHSHLTHVYKTRKIISNDQSKQFDDIVMWDSQITLYNSLRNGTCESSQAL